MEMKEDGKMVEGQPSTIHIDDSTRVKLADLGITPNQSSNYQASLETLTALEFQTIGNSLQFGSLAAYEFRNTGAVYGTLAAQDF
ncbi:MAG: hypothetical protein N4J56_004613 [Chroococcidiopsis sp. SAG 2025]|uniref:hypothetical protein n=1 Tax=Chroococcidiopsis sp. SAG 2025 TaxID=171389 RepID=UPI002936F697|nr:hypothetical protein [Chroococcidiopsis sp. SAG 2025]MDV2994959.1 hypothetical protein [Chroococcidiopsis sp. SAG 2025]